MASSFYTPAAYLIATGQLSLASDTLKIMLLGVANGGYTFDPAHRFIDPGVSGATSPLANELQATGYAGGFGGGGRLHAVITTTEDDTNDRIKLVFTNPVWSSLGGATNDTITGAIVVKELTSDAASPLVAYWALPNTQTAAKSFTIIMDPLNGNLQVLV